MNRAHSIRRRQPLLCIHCLFYHGEAERNEGRRSSQLIDSGPAARRRFVYSVGNLAGFQSFTRGYRIGTVSR
jgi:hypothetical protein